MQSRRALVRFGASPSACRRVTVSTHVSHTPNTARGNVHPLQFDQTKLDDNMQLDFVDNDMDDHTPLDHTACGSDRSKNPGPLWPLSACLVLRSWLSLPSVESRAAHRPTHPSLD
jgi:hypothetical protein